eukprot:scaffold654_cov207-Ochromonas_danica.AAC.8
MRWNILNMLLPMVVLLCLNLFVHSRSEHLTHELNNIWINRPLHSSLAKTIHEHQKKCTSKVALYSNRIFGMGSNLHVWTQAVCNAMQAGETLIQSDETWIWNDKEFCKDGNHTQPLSCYFNLQFHCPNAADVHPAKWTNGWNMCPKYIKDMDSRQVFRSAAIEYLFSNLNPRLVQEAQNAIKEVFGSSGIPKDMITLHVRLGDKHTEMKLVSPLEYYNAIDNFIGRHPNLTDPHIYVTTESLDGLKQLQEQLKSHQKTWKLHHYAPAVFNSNEVISPMEMAHRSQGSIGKHSIIALLLAMEARHYILTTGSNWSRLIDELRKNVVDVQCNHCTEMVDLRQANSKDVDNWRL